MPISLSGFKVIYEETVLNALAIESMTLPEEAWDPMTRKQKVKPAFLEVIAIDTDGGIVSVYDEAWKFQFIPILSCRGE